MLDHIARNHHRVQSIIKRAGDAIGEKGISFVLKQLTREDLLSEEQYSNLVQLYIDGGLTASRIAAIIKETKIGQGLIFLPRKLSDLTDNLNVWLEELPETAGASTIRNKIASVLEKLL